VMAPRVEGSGKSVKKRDPILGDRLAMELPNFCCRILTEYHALVKEFGDRDITQCFPPDIKEWGGDGRASSSKLYEFLSMNEEGRVVDIAGVTHTISFEKIDANDPKSPVTLREEFVKWYELWSKERFRNEPTAFSDHGFEGVKQFWVCRSCGRKSQAGCCEEYNREKNATKKNAILGMKIVVRNA